MFRLLPASLNRIVAFGVSTKTRLKMGRFSTAESSQRANDKWLNGLAIGARRKSTGRVWWTSPLACHLVVVLWWATKHVSAIFFNKTFQIKHFLCCRQPGLKTWQDMSCKLGLCLFETSFLLLVCLWKQQRFENIPNTKCMATKSSVFLQTYLKALLFGVSENLHKHDKPAAADPARFPQQQTSRDCE